MRIELLLVLDIRPVGGDTDVDLVSKDVEDARIRDAMDGVTRLIELHGHEAFRPTDEVKFVSVNEIRGVG